jgi:ParB/RepB/Spo0J family partition protein
VEALPEYNAYAIPMSQVWVDSEFNCRGRFTPQSVESLAKDIRDSGLQYPVIVQPWDNNPGHCYRLVAGFRRFEACRLLHMAEIPAMVTAKDISEFEAHKLNLIENLERQDLNILQEAEGIRKLFPLGETPGEIARELKRPRQWVYRRLGLLDLPHGVQLMFASGRLSQSDLDVVLAYREDSEAAQKAAVRLLEARRESPDETRKVRQQLRRGRKVADRRRRKAEIAEMIDRMFQMGLDGLPTRVAAWCAGTVTTEALLTDLEEACLENGSK